MMVDFLDVMHNVSLWSWLYVTDCIICDEQRMRHVTKHSHP